jgi:hypothetical protein
MRLFARESIYQDRSAGLTPRQKRFVAAYLATLRPKAAAIRAGYAPRYAAQTARDLLHKPPIADLVRAQLERESERLLREGERRLGEAAAIVFADRTAAVRAALRSKPGTRLRLPDKRPALDLLSRAMAVLRNEPNPPLGDTSPRQFGAEPPARGEVEHAEIGGEGPQRMAEGRRPVALDEGMRGPGRPVSGDGRGNERPPPAARREAQKDEHAQRGAAVMHGAGPRVAMRGEVGRPEGAEARWFAHAGLVIRGPRA